MFGGRVRAFVQPSVEEEKRVLLKTQDQWQMEALSMRLPCLDKAYSYRGTDGIYERDYFKINTNVLRSIKYLFMESHSELGEENPMKIKIMLTFHLII